MITLFHAPQSRSSRIIWLLEELGQPYTIKPVSIFRPMAGTGEPDPANPHPDKQVPAIVDGDTLVAESVAIVLYLADAFPAAELSPKAGDPRRGDYLTWLAWYAAAMEPAMFAQFGDELDNPMKKRGYDAVVRRIENALAEGPYMMGDSFTAADLLVASALAFGRQAFPESVAIDAYLERCKARPANLRAMALDDAEGVQAA
ncbi:MAG: glutathione S-transferase family protein [Sphingomonadales bacterium]|nr:MAG: glutathione S-transferase family protein [Sphingomonadales bacterium]